MNHFIQCFLEASSPARHLVLFWQQEKARETQIRISPYLLGKKHQKIPASTGSRTLDLSLTAELWRLILGERNSQLCYRGGWLLNPPGELLLIYLLSAIIPLIYRRCCLSLTKYGGN